jgi:hypothetical protein
MSSHYEKSIPDPGSKKHPEISPIDAEQKISIV